MKTITVNTKDLKTALALISKTVDKKSTLFVLSYVLLSVKDGWLRLSTTNLEQVTVCSIPAVISNGLFENYTPLAGVDHAALTIAVKAIGKEKSTVLGYDGGKLLVSNMVDAILDNGYPIDTLPLEEFPPLPPHPADVTPDIFWTMSAGSLLQAVNHVLFAAYKKDDARPVLSTIHVANTKNGLTFTTANGFILARFTCGAPGQYASGLFDLNVPAILFPALVKHLAALDPDSPVFVAYNKTKDLVSFVCRGNVTFFSTLTPGTYPDVDQVIPRACQNSTMLATRDLLAACDKAIALAKINGVKSYKDDCYAGIMALVLGNEKVAALWKEGLSDKVVTLATINATVDENNNVPLTIAFNPNFVKGVLTAANTDCVVMETLNGTSPAKFINNGHNLYVVMPMLWEK